jgi:hypothetical protein
MREATTETELDWLPKRTVIIICSEGVPLLRRKKTFEPFPHNLGFNDRDGSQNVDLLLNVLNTIPPISVMKECASDEQLKVILDDIDPLCFPLLKWVIRSNRAHVSYVPKEKQIEVSNENSTCNVVNLCETYHTRKYSNLPK